VGRKGRDILVVDPNSKAVVRNGRDAVPGFREWYHQNLADAIRTAKMGESSTDVGVACNWWLMQRLKDPKTPKEIKDRIALAMAPRFMAELKGKIGAGGPQSSAVTDLVEGYKLG
jgi:hypothetical protein